VGDGRGGVNERKAVNRPKVEFEAEPPSHALSLDSSVPPSLDTPTDPEVRVMPLLAFWKSARDEVSKLSIEQIVSSAGDGVLKDNSPCSDELREYLSEIPSETIAAYIDQCLASSFAKGGMVLQDLVNELGRRLGYLVENGRYQGVRNANGFDGLWLSPEHHSIVVEVKTTDAYRISLDTIAAYRSKLSDALKITGPSSILIVVGRDDTGDLEAQIRGSRHAWDVRLISADALVKLVQLKENTEAGETELKIRSLLIPKEYTRLDNIIDVMFTAAADVEATTAATVVDQEETKKLSTETGKQRGVWQFTDKLILGKKRDQIIAALDKRLDTTFIRKKGAYYWDSKHERRLVCTISKRYQDKSHLYWFGYHHEWHDFLLIGHDGYITLGCMDLGFAFAIPAKAIDAILLKLNATMIDDRVDYWHLRIVEVSPECLGLAVPNSQPFALEKYRISLE
jgi:hypothetical protein